MRARTNLLNLLISIRVEGLDQSVLIFSYQKPLILSNLIGCLACTKYFHQLFSLRKSATEPINLLRQPPYYYVMSSKGNCTCTVSM